MPSDLFQRPNAPACSKFAVTFRTPERTDDAKFAERFTKEAQALAALRPEDTPPTAAGEHATLSILGTPAYSASEQKTHPRIVENRADIYSLGVVFCEMLTGELPPSVRPSEPTLRHAVISSPG